MTNTSEIYFKSYIEHCHLHQRKTETERDRGEQEKGEREGERHTHKNTHGQTDRQTDKQTANSNTPGESNSGKTRIPRILAYSMSSAISVNEYTNVGWYAPCLTQQQQQKILQSPVSSLTFLFYQHAQVTRAQNTKTGKIKTLIKKRNIDHSRKITLLFLMLLWPWNSQCHGPCMVWIHRT